AEEARGLLGMRGEHAGARGRAERARADAVRDDVQPVGVDAEGERRRPRHARRPRLRRLVLAEAGTEDARGLAGVARGEPSEIALGHGVEHQLEAAWGD